MNYKRMADLAWGNLIHATGRCAVCGRQRADLEAHHIIPRNNLLTRHEPSNGILLCREHHAQAHADKRAFLAWLDMTDPGRARWVRANRWTNGKPDYKQAYERLTNEVK